MGHMNLANDDEATSDLKEETDDGPISSKPATTLKRNKTKFKKAPQAPRRFKSAYMFFSTTKHKEIRDDLMSKGVEETTTNIAKLVSQAWKELSPEEREQWEEMARKDKARFEVEKSMYTGPWKVPAKKRAIKDPSAPKRPMSAFLAYSHAKRAQVKNENPNMNNAEISRVLAQMWKDASEEEKHEHIEHEYELRQKYLREIAVWREKSEKELENHRRHREELAMKTVAARAENQDDEGVSREGEAPPQHYLPYENRDHDTEGGNPGGGGDYSGYYPPHPHYFAGPPPPRGAYGAEYGPPPPYYSHYYPPVSHYDQQYGRDGEHPPPPPSDYYGYGYYYSPPPPPSGGGPESRGVYPEQYYSGYGSYAGYEYGPGGYYDARQSAYPAQEGPGREYNAATSEDGASYPPPPYQHHPPHVDYQPPGAPPYPREEETEPAASHPDESV